MPKVCLVKCHGKSVTVGVGSHTFPIENGELSHSESQRLGCEANNQLEEYDDAYDLAAWAWVHKEFDEVEEN